VLQPGGLEQARAGTETNVPAMMTAFDAPGAASLNYHLLRGPHCLSI